MTKFLDTSVLVKHESGNNKGHFNWSANIGKEVPFIYDDLSGVIKILDFYTKNGRGRITLQYKDKIQENHTSNLLKLNLLSLLGKNKTTTEYTYQIDDIIDKEYQSSKVLKQIRIPYEKADVRGYELQCTNCNYIYQTREDRLSSCPICGIRATESEKIIYSIFMQSNTKFEVQKEFEWLKTRWYDAYLPQYNAIVEINGLQHYEPTSLPDRNLKTAEEQFQFCIESDKLKKDTALEHGLNYYIIDASDHNTIFKEAQNILNFIDFSNVSEFECKKFAVQNKIQKYCNLWNAGFSLEEISELTNRSISTVQGKLRIGNTYKLCNYNKKNNLKYGVINPLTPKNFPPSHTNF